MAVLRGWIWTNRVDKCLGLKDVEHPMHDFSCLLTPRGVSYQDHKNTKR